MLAAYQPGWCGGHLPGHYPTILLPTLLCGLYISVCFKLDTQVSEDYSLSSCPQFILNHFLQVACFLYETFGNPQFLSKNHTMGFFTPTSQVVFPPPLWRNLKSSLLNSEGTPILLFGDPLWFLQSGRHTEGVHYWLTFWGTVKLTSKVTAPFNNPPPHTPALFPSLWSSPALYWLSFWSQPT